VIIPTSGFHDLAYNLSQTYILMANRLGLPVMDQMTDTCEFAKLLEEVDPLLLSTSMSTLDSQHFLLGILHQNLCFETILGLEGEESDGDY
jgi:hypothetical protein